MYAISLTISSYYRLQRKSPLSIKSSTVVKMVMKHTVQVQKKQQIISHHIDSMESILYALYSRLNEIHMLSSHASQYIYVYVSIV